MDREWRENAGRRMQNVIRELKAEREELIYPLSRMICEEREDMMIPALSTDGRRIFYTYDHVAGTSNYDLKCEIMHILFHGILGHFESNEQFTQKELAWVVMDAQAELLLERYGMQNRRDRLSALNRALDDHCGFGHYYRALEDEGYAWRLGSLKYRLLRDDHRLWSPLEKEREKVGELWGMSRKCLLGEGYATGENGAEGLLRQLVGGYGTAAGGYGKRVRLEERSDCSYEELLRRLLAERETARENPDSIDVMLYQYGLELYEDMPLVEPGENEGRTAVNTVVLALDTSGSCEERLGKFWRETFEFFSRLGRRAAEGEIVLLQCDCRIWKEERFALEDFPKEAPEEMETAGFGGTSFEPVFERVAELQAEGKTIDGLIYFTDGMGTYPQEAPNYPVFFILPDRRYRGGQPEWITLAYMERDGG